MTDQEPSLKKNVARAKKTQKQPKKQPKQDKSKPTSWGTKVWNGLKVGFWIWNAAKRCWELLEGDPSDVDDTDLTESTESENSDDTPQ